MRYRTWRTTRSRSTRSSSAGISNGMPVALMRCLARLMRWAMVASGTMNAFAICAVVRPPTARSVSAIWDGGVSAGWRQRKRRVSLVVFDHARAVRRKGDELLAWRESRGHVRATSPGLIASELIGQAPGRDGDQPAARALRDALVGPLDGGGEKRLLHGVLAGVEVAVPPDEVAQDL